MKKVQLKAFTKRVTACALAAAMILSTPSTAFAAEFSDNFPTVFSTDENGSHTDSIDPDEAKGTDTTTIKENIGEITDLIIYGSKNISLKPGNEMTLSAALLTSGKVDNAAMATLNKQIKWTSSNPSVVSIRRDEVNPNKCILNPRMGSSEPVIIKAELEQVKYDEFGEIKETRTLEDEVTVTVREPKTSDFQWKKIDPKTDKFYVKGTYCLSELLYMNGSPLSSQIGDGKELNSASDVVTFAVKCSSKVATVSGDMLTIKKANEEITLLAILSNEKNEVVEPSLTITTEAGSPVKKLIASESKIELDFGEKENVIPTYDVSVEVETVDGDATTDEIIWSTSNPAVATVDVDPNKPDDQTRAQITAEGVGKATITAKATSGKTAKFSVTVKATLIRLEIVPQDKNEYAWSGKTEELVINRVPGQNKDKLKVTSADKRVKVKSTAGSVMITPVADLKLANDEEKKKDGEGENEFEYIEVGITVENADASAETTIKVRQSNVRIKKVMDIATIPEPTEPDSEESSGDTPTAKDMDKQTVRANIGNEFAYTTELFEKNNMPGNEAVSWVSSNTKVATISAGGELEVVGAGTAKITASSVYQVSKGKYATSKKTFTVKATPECEEIVFKSATLAYDAQKKKAVTINIKQQLPKKANDEIDWYVNGVKQKKDKKYATDKKLTLQSSAFKDLKEGATVEVMAVARVGEDNRPLVYAVATVYVVKPAAKKIAFKTKKTSLSVGATSDIAAPSVTGSKNDPIVNYTVDKKGASVVSAEPKAVKQDDGTVKQFVTLTAIGEGKATVTAYTASGKKATLKVEVKGGSGSSSKEDEKEDKTEEETKDKQK